MNTDEPQPLTAKIISVVDGDTVDVELSQVAGVIPEPQIVLGSCKIDRVIDGDTIVVSCVRRIRVRFRSWSAESHKTKHTCEKSLGIAATDHLAMMAAEGTPCRLAIATDGDEDLGDGLTFGRVVGDVYLMDGSSNESLGGRMITAGHAFETKRQLQQFLTDTDNADARALYDEQ